MAEIQQTFLLLENLQDEEMTSEDCANWYLKCMNTAFDKLKSPKPLGVNNEDSHKGE